MLQGKKGRFLYDLVRAGSQPTLGTALVPDSHHYRSWRSGIDDGNEIIGQLPAIASGMDIVLLKVSVVVPKPFVTGTTIPISCSGHLARTTFGTPCTICLLK